MLETDAGVLVVAQRTPERIRLAVPARRNSRRRSDGTGEGGDATA